METESGGEVKGIGECLYKHILCSSAKQWNMEYVCDGMSTRGSNEVVYDAFFFSLIQ